MSNYWNTKTEIKKKKSVTCMQYILSLDAQKTKEKVCLFQGVSLSLLFLHLVRPKSEWLCTTLGRSNTGGSMMIRTLSN